MLAEIKSFIPDQIRHLKIGRFRRNKIKEIPIELLIEIFLHCLPTDRFPIPSRCEAPILLGRVCRVWRSVSLNTPQLWAQITLSSWYYPIDIWKSENFHRIGIHEWIRRSGNSPFSFEIGVHDEEHISAPLLTLTLRAEARRWKSVRLQTNCYCMHHILHILWIPGHTPMLTDLRFHTTDSFKKYYMPITSVPQLSTFYLDSRYNPFFKSGKFHALHTHAMSFAGNLRDHVSLEIPAVWYGDGGVYFESPSHLHPWRYWRGWATVDAQFARRTCPEFIGHIDAEKSTRIIQRKQPSFQLLNAMRKPFAASKARRRLRST